MKCPVCGLDHTELFRAGMRHQYEAKHSELLKVKPLPKTLNWFIVNKTTRDVVSYGATREEVEEDFSTWHDKDDFEIKQAGDEV